LAACGPGATARLNKPDKVFGTHNWAVPFKQAKLRVGVMHTDALKQWLKNRLEGAGLYVRKRAGLPVGFDVFRDLERWQSSTPAIILDIGAYVGEYTVWFSTKYPNAKIFAFEPVAANFQQLKANMVNFPGVECVNAAVGSSNGMSTINIGVDSQTHTLQGRASGRTETVRVITVDTFLSERALGNADFIKIDAEGYELPILDGAAHALSDRRIGMMLIEATLKPDDRFHTPLSELQTQLLKYGFGLIAIYDQDTAGWPPHLNFFNALFGRIA
jgi:FkbM family methyltransferase